jgi:hypothetical protein
MDGFDSFGGPQAAQQPQQQQSQQAMVPPNTMNMYWAKKPAQEVCDALQQKEQEYFTTCNRRGLSRLWRLAYAQAFGMNPEAKFDMQTQSLAFVGPEAEFVRFRINEVRSYVKQANAMAQNSRPAFQCLSLNADVASVGQIDMSQSIVDYLYKENVGEQREREVLESDGWFGCGFAWLRWDPDGGDDVDVPMQIPGKTMPDGTPAVTKVKQRSGSPKLTSLYPWEIVQEPYTRDPLWRMVRERASKWELAANFPELADQILSVSNVREQPAAAEMYFYDIIGANDDDVIVRHFYHRRCAALPEGRYVGMVDNVVLWDRPCPHPSKIPILEMCSGKFFGTAFGYADTWDLMAIQQMLDEMCSKVATNICTFGIPTIFAEEGLQIDRDAIAQGKSVFTYKPGQEMPKAMEINGLPDSTKFFFEYLQSRFMSVSQLNSVVRGEPEQNIESGTMAALFHSIAIEYQSGRQAALDTFREECANMMLDMVRSYAETPFLVEVSGKGETPYLKEFTAQSVSGVRRVRVVTANPLLRSQAGRLELFLQIKDLPPDQRASAIELITSGDASGFTDETRSADLRIRWENERLTLGVPCQVSATDNPFQHVRKHVAQFEALMSMDVPDSRAIEQLLMHINLHVVTYMKMDPLLAVMLRIPPPPPLPGTPAGNIAMLTGMPMMPGSERMGDPAASGSTPKAPPMPKTQSPSGVDNPKPAKPPEGSGVSSQAGPGM